MEFIGKKYKMTSSENFDEFMKAIGKWFYKVLSKIYRFFQEIIDACRQVCRPRHLLFFTALYPLRAFLFENVRDQVFVKVLVKGCRSLFSRFYLIFVLFKALIIFFYPCRSRFFYERVFFILLQANKQFFLYLIYLLFIIQINIYLFFKFSMLLLMITSKICALRRFQGFLKLSSLILNFVLNINILNKLRITICYNRLKVTQWCLALKTISTKRYRFITGQVMLDIWKQIVANIP